jgi:hypothetical protein
MKFVRGKGNAHYGLRSLFSASNQYSAASAATSALGPFGDVNKYTLLLALESEGSSSATASPCSANPPKTVTLHNPLQGADASCFHSLSDILDLTDLVSKLELKKFIAVVVLYDAACWVEGLLLRVLRPPIEQCTAFVTTQPFFCCATQSILHRPWSALANGWGSRIPSDYPSNDRFECVAPGREGVRHRGCTSAGSVGYDHYVFYSCAGSSWTTHPHVTHSRCRTVIFSVNSNWEKSSYSVPSYPSWFAFHLCTIACCTIEHTQSDGAVPPCAPSTLVAIR